MSKTTPTVESLTEDMRVMRDNFTEKLSELEREDRGWISLSGANETDFSREGLRKITRDSFLFYLKNPLMRRGVTLQADYVYAQGVTIKAVNPVVDGVVQSFLDDPLNKAVWTTIRKMIKVEIDLQITANLFFLFFKNGKGEVRVRFVDFDEVRTIRCNPDDADEPWMYFRQWRVKGERKMRKMWYPDWRYRPTDKPPTYKKVDIDWDNPIYHVKVNAVRGQMFGTSELYAAQDWARAYNKFLENWSTLVASYARFAWDITSKGGSAARAAMKGRLDSGIADGGDLSMPPSVASAAIHGDGTSVQPIRTAGATTSMEDGRRLALMVFAALGWPETFFGDVSVGSLATAESLDRPTELKCLRRQRLWEDVWEEVTGFVIQCAAEVGIEGLSGDWIEDDWGAEKFVYANDEANEDPDKNGEPIDTHVDVVFPDIVETDVLARVQAIVTGANLGGFPFAGTINPKYTTEQILHALGETSVEEVIAEWFPEGEDTNKSAIVAAVSSLQGAVEALAEEHDARTDDVVVVLAEAFTGAMKQMKESSENSG